MTPTSRISRILASPRRRWVALAVVVTLLVAVLGRAELGRMWRSFLTADWRWVAVSLGLMLVSLGLRSSALTLIIRAYGCVRPRVRDAFSSTSIGLLANAVIPVRVGSLLNPYVLFLLLRRRGETVPFATTLGMTITEQLFSATTFVAFSLVAVSMLSAPAWATPALVTSAVLLVLGLGGAVALQSHRLRGSADRALAGKSCPEAPSAGPHWRGALRTALPHFLDSQRILARPLSSLLVAGVQAAAWLVQLAAAYAALHAFHLGGAGWRGAALVLVVTNLIGILPLTPGNVGTFQVAATAALAAYGIPSGPALAFALGLQAMQLLVGIVAGLVSLSLQNLALGDVAGRSRHAAHLLRRGEPVPPHVEEPAGG